jgi:hypothetical protein
MSAENDNFQQKVALLQKKHVVAVEEKNQILTIAQTEKRHLQAECERLHVQRRTSKQVAAVAEKHINKFWHMLFEIRHQTVAQLQALQGEIASFKTQFTQHSITDISKIAEFAKLEAFDLWIQRSPDAEEQVSAQSLILLVT